MNLTNKQQIQENQYGFPYHYLDLGSEEYKYIWNVEPLQKLKKVIELLIEFNVKSVLDAGCGDGRFAYELGDTTIKYLGVDFSESAIRFANAFNPSKRFLISDLSTMNLSHKFEAIVLIETLEHIPLQSVRSLIQNLKRHLTKEGILIVTVPSVNLPIQNKHYQHFSPKSLRSTLKSHFEDVQVFGLSQSGIHRSGLNVLRSFCLIIYPFRTRMLLFKKMLLLYEVYYSRYGVDSKPEKALSLIAICKKKL